jgi:hypothetical protein
MLLSAFSISRTRRSQDAHPAQSTDFAAPSDDVSNAQRTRETTVVGLPAPRGALTATRSRECRRTRRVLSVRARQPDDFRAAARCHSHTTAPPPASDSDGLKRAPRAPASLSDRRPFGLDAAFTLAQPGRCVKRHWTSTCGGGVMTVHGCAVRPLIPSVGRSEVPTAGCPLASRARSTHTDAERRRRRHPETRGRALSTHVAEVPYGHGRGRRAANAQRERRPFRPAHATSRRLVAHRISAGCDGGE